MRSNVDAGFILARNKRPGHHYRTAVPLAAHARLRA